MARSRKSFFSTKRGEMVLGDSVDVLKKRVSEKSVDLIVTSPPFALVRKKGYGNADEDEVPELVQAVCRCFQTCAERQR